MRTRVRTASSHNTRPLHGAYITLCLYRRKHVAHVRRVRGPTKPNCRHVRYREICSGSFTVGYLGHRKIETAL